jgi:hypothetical protein
VLLIGIYPYLQAIGLECPVWVYPTLEKGEPRSKLSKSRNIKNAVAAFVQRMVLGKAFQSSLLCRRVLFSSGKKSIKFGQISESRHPQIHLLLMPLAVLRNVPQGLEAYIGGGQSDKPKDSWSVFEIYRSST